MVRVRFAPSPTGYLHIGGLKMALYDKLFALRHGGTYYLRIEDTDQERLVPGAVESLLRTLAWAGLEPDEGPYLDANGHLMEKGAYGPYVQSARQALYKKYADELLAAGHAYRCFCSVERLDEMRRGQELMKQPVKYDGRCRQLDASEAARRAAAGEAHVIRFRMPQEGTTEVVDLIRGRVVFENALLDDFVIVKGDGFPTYHLAHLVDDHLMETTHVFRGEEWFPSAPRHVRMFLAMGWEPPQYAHLPLILNPDRSKLSKRQGDVAVEDYRAKGYLPEALVNFVATMGWNPSADREIYSMEELGKLFEIGDVNKGGAVFNREKLDWLNREYLKLLPAEQLVSLALPFLVKAGWLEEKGGELVSKRGETVGRPFLGKALSLEQTRVTTLAELPEAISYFLDDDYPLDSADLPWRKSTPEETRERLNGLVECCTGLDEQAFASPSALEEKIMGLISARGWGNGDTLWPMRVALTGRRASPSPFEVAWALGQEATIKRLKRALDLLT